MDITIVIIFVISPLLYLVNAYFKNDYKKLFKEVSRKLRLNLVPGGPGCPSLSGMLEGCAVDVKRNQDGRRRGSLEIRIPIKMDLQGEIHIRKESLVSRMEHAVGLKDIEIGDPGFDDAVLMRAAHPGELTAFLDRETRDKIKELATRAKYLEIVNAYIEVYMKSSMFMKPGPLITMIQLAVGVGRSLGQEISLEDRYLDNIKNDPIARVRVNNIRALAAGSALSPVAESVLKRALADPEVMVQLEAAQHLGKQGLVHFSKLLEKGAVTDSGIIIEIIRRFQVDNYKESTPLLEKIYGVKEDRKIKTAILRAFTAFGEGEVLPLLYRELVAADPHLLPQVIAALGTCAGVEAVEQLYNLGKASRDTGVRKSVKEAITAIQSRLGHAERGWLSPARMQELDGALSPPGQDSSEDNQDNRERETKGLGTR